MARIKILGLMVLFEVLSDMYSDFYDISMLMVVYMNMVRSWFKI